MLCVFPCVAFHPLPPTLHTCNHSVSRSFVKWLCQFEYMRNTHTPHHSHVLRKTAKKCIPKLINRMTTMAAPKEAQPNQQSPNESVGVGANNKRCFVVELNTNTRNIYFKLPHKHEFKCSTYFPIVIFFFDSAVCLLCHWLGQKYKDHFKHNTKFQSTKWRWNACVTMCHCVGRAGGWTN